MADIGNCPIFVAENGNVVHNSADPDTKIENETEISSWEGRKTEIVNMIVADIGNYRSLEPPCVRVSNFVLKKSYVFCVIKLVLMNNEVFV